MGLTFSPNHCQEIMQSIFQDIEQCDVFIDDIGVFSETWEDHMEVLEQILQR